MMLSSYHTHSTFSDGKSTLEEMVQAAIAQGCQEIGFSDHAPMIFDCGWSMKQEKVELKTTDANGKEQTQLLPGFVEVDIRHSLSDGIYKSARDIAYMSLAIYQIR